MNIYARDRFGNTIQVDPSAGYFKVEYRKIRDDIGLSNDYQRLDSDYDIYQTLPADACK